MTRIIPGGGYNGIDIVRHISELNVSERTCVWIMLQNGMLHWDIALDIYRNGINRLLFLPMKIGSFCDTLKREFIEQYNYMMEEDYASLQVPYLTDEMFGERNRGKCRLEKWLHNGEGIIWVPLELVRTTLCEQEKYRDKPIAEFDPYFKLFKHLSGVDNDISEYISLYGKAPKAMTVEDAYQYVLKKRSVLYDFFENNFNSGNINYFVAAAPKADWNDKGYLNLCEGQHRCVYLLFRGMKQVPVRVTKEALYKLDIA